MRRSIRGVLSGCRPRRWLKRRCVHVPINAPRLCSACATSPLQAAAKKRLAPIRKVVDNLLALPLGRDPPQNKKSIEAQESAIKALANLEYYDLLANPDLLSQFAVIDKRFPEAPEVYGAAQLPDWSIKTLVA